MKRVGIVGYRGYSGAELLHLLDRHAHVEPVLMDHREDPGGTPAIRRAQPPARIACTGDAVRQEGLAVVFLATPPEVSMELAPLMLASGARVVDLSGAFRLGTAAHYAAWYKEPHTQPELLAEAVYGLPEFCRDLIPAARLVSNPGCYPTAANLALRPLVQAGVIDRASGIVCDAKSGVSGAGRKPSLKTSFCEVTENFSAYSILYHRHVPEVLQICGLEEHEFSFTAQLLPVHPGIPGTLFFPSPFHRRRGRPARHLRAAVRRRTLRAPLQPAAHARPRRRCPHQFLRYWRHLRRAHQTRRRRQRHR